MHDAHPRPALPAGVWVLGFVSLLMDVSSEMIHSLLPLFLVGTLGLSVLAVGVIAVSYTHLTLPTNREV